MSYTRKLVIHARPRRRQRVYYQGISLATGFLSIDRQTKFTFAAEGMKDHRYTVRITVECT